MSNRLSIAEAREAHQTLLQVERYRTAGDLDQARTLCERLIQHYPDYPAALATLGLILTRQGEYAAALPHLFRAAIFNPRDWNVLSNLGEVYLQLDAVESAVRVLDQALQLAPERYVTLYRLGRALVLQHRYESAAVYLERACAKGANYTAARVALAGCYRHVGREQEAAALLREILNSEASPDDKAYVCIEASMLSDQTGLDFDVAEAIESLDEPPHGYDDATRFNLAFARASLFDRRGQYRQAWDRLLDVNAAEAAQYEEQRQTFRNNADALMKRSLDWPSPVRAGTEVGDALAETTPVSLCILGPSRSGKTTLENMIGELPGVLRLGERPLVKGTAQQLSMRAGLLTTEFLGSLPGALDDAIARTYTAKLLDNAGREAKVVTLTHPGMIYDAGRIVECISNAKFVFIKRDADDTAFRIFGRYYSKNTNVFAYDLDDIYEYVAGYHALIDHWHERLGDKAMLVSYEEMAADPAATLDRVARFCGLQVPDDLVLRIADDSGCSRPYSEWMRAARA